jgi:hypothetical protein
MGAGGMGGNAGMSGDGNVAGTGGSAGASGDGNLAGTGGSAGASGNGNLGGAGSSAGASGNGNLGGTGGNTSQAGAGGTGGNGVPGGNGGEVAAGGGSGGANPAAGGFGGEIAGAGGMSSQPPASGAGGSMAGAGGTGASGSMAVQPTDRALITQLVALLGIYAANDAAAALIVLLSGSDVLAPSSMTQVLMLLEQIGGCPEGGTACQSACTVVLTRCPLCSGDPNCHAAMERVCGEGSSSCS